MIEFTVPGHIVPWARTGSPKAGSWRFTPKKQRDYAATVKDMCIQSMRGAPPINGPIELSIVGVWPWPKSMTKKHRALPWSHWKESKPDSDNVTKIIKDALKLVAWRDDAQVAASFVWKRYGDRAGVTVRIRSLAEEVEYGEGRLDAGARREVAQVVS